MPKLSEMLTLYADQMTTNLHFRACLINAAVEADHLETVIASYDDEAVRRQREQDLIGDCNAIPTESRNPDFDFVTIAHLRNVIEKEHLLRQLESAKMTAAYNDHGRRIAQIEQSAPCANKIPQAETTTGIYSHPGGAR
jgi:hypothetical protein